MSPRPAYICSLFCESECEHGVVCEAFTSNFAHPLKRGREQHFGLELGTWTAHEWNGKHGRCHTFEIETEDEDDPFAGEPEPLDDVTLGPAGREALGG
jgi:hypothetical protein